MRIRKKKKIQIKKSLVRDPWGNYKKHWFKTKKQRERELKIYLREKQRRLRLRKKRVVTVRVILKQTINNMFINISNFKGKVLLKKSGGSLLGHRSRHTGYTAEALGRYIGKKLVQKHVYSYHLVVLGFVNKYTSRVIKGLRIFESVKCSLIKFVANFSHNGVRLRALKRK